MNRKGQIAMLMLFLTAILLVILALVTFTTVDRKFRDASLLVGQAASGVDFGQNYVLSSTKLMAKNVILGNAPDLKSSFQGVAAGRAALGIQEAGTFFRIIGEGSFSFDKIGDKYLFVAGKTSDENKKVFVEKASGYNDIRRYFVVCMIFDSKGEYLSEWANQDLYAKNCK